jgi:hypothetical protein
MAEHRRHSVDVGGLALSLSPNGGGSGSGWGRAWDEHETIGAEVDEDRIRCAAFSAFRPSISLTD